MNALQPSRTYNGHHFGLGSPLIVGVEEAVVAYSAGHRERVGSLGIHAVAR